jgi:hypothetical protein
MKVYPVNGQREPTIKRKKTFPCQEANSFVNAPIDKSMHGKLVGKGLFVFFWSEMYLAFITILFIIAIFNLQHFKVVRSLLR